MGLSLNKMNIAFFGAGKWGKNYIPILESLGANIRIGNRNNWRDILQDNWATHVIIATPPENHIEIALVALKKNLPIMVEKPIALTSQEVLNLMEYESNTPVLVNYIHLFSPAFQKMYDMLKNEEIIKINSMGCNRGPFRNYSSLFDYAPHDLSMGMYLAGDLNFDKFCCHAKDENGGTNYNIKAYYGDIKHNIFIGNGSKEKKRYLEVICESNNKYVYDDLSINKLVVNKEPVEISKTKPLENSIGYFLEFISTGKVKPIWDLKFSLDITKYLEMISI
jgi:predicted dehydrogenase